MAGHAMHETNAVAWAAMRAAQAAERRARKEARRAANRAAWWARYGLEAPEPADAETVAETVDPTPDPTPEPFELEAVEVPGDYVAFELLPVPTVDALPGFTVNHPSEGQGRIKTFGRNGLRWDLEHHDGTGAVTLYTPAGDVYECPNEAEAVAGILWDWDRIVAAAMTVAKFERGTCFTDVLGRVATITGAGKTIRYTYGETDATGRVATRSATVYYDAGGELISVKGAGVIRPSDCFTAADAA